MPGGVVYYQVTRLFQSTPPVSGRRCPAICRALETDQRCVSIHAPRFREAMQELRNAGLVEVVVSIHAPRFREAMRHPPAGRRPA